MRLRKNHLNYFFHPYEITISGFSNTGKTTLISSVVKELSKNFKTGYLKHDAHNFKVDYPGKDTALIREAGAVDTLINDQGKFAYLSDKILDQVETSELMKDNDILIIEGHKYSQIPKIVLLGTGSVRDKTIQEIEEGQIKNIIAIVSEDHAEENPFPEYPYFSRNNTKEVTQFIQDYFKELVPKKIFGLVLTGGKSERMNKDKGGLKYFEKDQVAHTVDLLTPFCDGVYVSCREDQSEHEFIIDHKQIHDNFPSVGPSSGILSAMHKHPDTAWLVIACDLPYLTSDTISHLLKNRNPFKGATCYLNPTRGWPEPLCSIYEPKLYNKLIQYFGMGKPCPRKVLFNSEVKRLELLNKNDLDNVNTPDEFIKAKDYIQQNQDPSQGDSK